MNLNRRQMIIGSAAGLAAMGITRPSFAQDVASSDMAATGVPYVKKEQINGGQPIKLSYWEWVGTRAEYEARWAREYMAMYPNVTIEVVTQPWEAYWQALSANIQSGSPELYHMHVGRAAEYCDANLMSPIPESVADMDFLTQHWVGFAEGAMDCIGSGQRSYVPMGTMLPILLINTDMWTAAGLTDADIPKSWEQLRAAAVKLTQRDARGRITVAGLNMIPQEYLQNAVYQQGRYLFTADTKRVQVLNPEYKRAVQFFSDLMHVDKVFDPALAEQQWNAFLGKTAAMYIGFSWVVGTVRPLAEINWIGVPMPTPTGEYTPAYGNLRFAVEAVVNPFASDAAKAVAWDFWHFNYARDEVVLRDMALQNGFLPAYDKLLNHEAVTSDQVTSSLAPTVDYGVISDVPEPVRAEQVVLLESVILDPSDLDGKLAAAERAMNAQLAQREAWPILERNYKHHDLMIPDQP
jgi:multiple sugar transport system substrate-binding protein